MEKAIITVVGKDQVGIIAKVCAYLADAQINILDISQTILDGFFNMMMIVDASHAKGDFYEIAEKLELIINCNMKISSIKCIESKEEKDD